MSLPGFTAEATIRRPSSKFRLAGSPTEGVGREMLVRPAQCPPATMMPCQSSGATFCDLFTHTLVCQYYCTECFGNAGCHTVEFWCACGSC